MKRSPSSSTAPECGILRNGETEAHPHWVIIGADEQDLPQAHQLEADAPGLSSKEALAVDGGWTAA